MPQVRRPALLSLLLTLCLMLAGPATAGSVEILLKNRGKEPVQVFSAIMEPSAGGMRMVIEGWTLVPGKRTRKIKSTSNTARFAIGFVTEGGFHPLALEGGNEFSTGFPMMVPVKPGQDFKIAYTDPNTRFPEGYVAAAVSEPMKVPANGRYQFNLNINFDRGEFEPVPFLDLNARPIRDMMEFR